MSEFNTYRVRVCEERCIAINLSARGPQDACNLAASIHAHAGSEPFQELSASLDHATFEAEEISGADLPANSQPPSHQRGRGGRSR